MKERFKLLELRKIWRNIVKTKSREKGRTDTAEFIILIIIDSNFRVKWLPFLRQRVKKAEEPLKLRLNFISRCSKVDYLYYRRSGNTDKELSPPLWGSSDIFMFLEIKCKEKNIPHGFRIYWLNSNPLSRSGPKE